MTTSPASALQTWSVPGKDGSEGVLLVAEAGKATLVVGPNGAGKSALAWHLGATGRDVRRLLAHRKIWFDVAGPDIAPSQRDQLSGNIRSWYSDASSRYLDHANTQRTGIVLFDLIAQYNYENSLIAQRAREGVLPPTTDLGSSVLDRLNGIFAGAGLALTFTLTPTSTIAVHHSQRDVTYAISRMSDGEKSALLLAAEVLSGPPGLTFVIDEPERHLHRSISAGLIAAVIADRKDAHFVILTHDLDLAAALPECHTTKYVLRDCTWAGDAVTGWDLRAVPGSDMPDETRRAVLGGRSRLLFLEGQEQSLDSGVFRLLYPNLTLSPVGSCNQVVRAVGGVRETAEHHWLEAVGVIDADGREPDEVTALAERGVLVLPLSEIESVYYLSAVLTAVAERQGESLGLDATALRDQAVSAAFAALAGDGVAERMSASVAEKVVYRRATDALPDREAIMGAGNSVAVTVESPYEALRVEFGRLLAKADYDGLIKAYPVRDSSMRSAVCNALRFKSVADYESSVLARLRADKSLLQEVRTLLGPLPFGA